MEYPCHTATFYLVTRVRLRNFCNDERWMSFDPFFYIIYLCKPYRNLFQNGADDMSKIVIMVNDFFVKEPKILCKSDQPILYKFHQVMAKISIMELQIVFKTSNASIYSARPTEAWKGLYFQISCKILSKKMMF